MNIELYQRILVNLNDLFRLKPTVQLAEDIKAIEEWIKFKQNLEDSHNKLGEILQKLSDRIDEDLQQRHNNLFKENGEFRSLPFGEIKDKVNNRPIFKFNHDPNLIITSKTDKDELE